MWVVRPSPREIVIPMRVRFPPRDLGEPRECGRVFVTRAHKSRAWLASLLGKLRSDLGEASFGKGMASAMPQRNQISTALAAEVEQKFGDVL